MMRWILGYSTDKVNIGNLPDNIIINIFRNLNTRDLVLGVPKVCMKWSRIAVDPSLLRVATFQWDDGINTKDACAFLMTCSANLQELNILRREDTVALLHTASRNNKGLKVLNIRGSKVSVKKDDLRLLINGCHGIESIALIDTNGKNEGENYLKELSLLHNLKKVRLGSNQQVYKYNFASPDADVEHLCSSCPQITELKLPAIKWTDSAVFSVLKLKNLEVLGIRFGLGVTRNSLLYIPNLKNLRELDFSHIKVDVTSATWMAMFSNAAMQHLKGIGFTSCSAVNDEVLSIIAANCKELKRIRLAKCKEFTETGFQKIITKCNKLVEINVYVTKYRITVCFVDIPVFLPRLQVLVVGAMPFPMKVQERLTRLEHKLPRLKVKTNYRL